MLVAKVDFAYPIIKQQDIYQSVCLYRRIKLTAQPISSPLQGSFSCSWTKCLKESAIFGEGTTNLVPPQVPIEALPLVIAKV